MPNGFNSQRYLYPTHYIHITYRRAHDKIIKTNKKCAEFKWKLL